VAKRYRMYAAARNLGVILRALFGIGTPRSLQTAGEASPCAGLAGLLRLAMRLRRLGNASARQLAAGWSSLASTPALRAA